MQSRARQPKEISSYARAAICQGPTDELAVRLANADAPVGKVNLKSQVIDDPQVVHNGALTEVDHGPLGRVRVARAAALFQNSNLPALRTAPHLGEHGEQVLRELGYDEAHISALKQAVSHGLGGAGLNEIRIYASPANHIMTFFWVEVSAVAVPSSLLTP